MHRPEKKDNFDQEIYIMKGLSITLANIYKIYGINGVHEKLMIFCNCDIQMMIKYLSFKPFTKHFAMSVENI